MSSLPFAPPSSPSAPSSPNPSPVAPIAAESVRRSASYNGPCINENCIYGPARNERPDWAKAVTITWEEINHVTGIICRAVQLVGIVVPGKTSLLRSGELTPTSMSGKNTTGYPDQDKGHIMSLDTGGPNIKQNIVPQWAGQQRCGSWRKAEMEIRKLADAALTQNKKFTLVTIELFYKEWASNCLRYASFDRLTFPRWMKASIQVASGPSQTMFDEELRQDDLDDERLLKTEIMFNGWGESQIWDDVVVTKKNKTGKIHVKFQKDGQDVRYCPPPPTVQYPLRSNMANSSAVATALTRRRSKDALPVPMSDDES